MFYFPTPELISKKYGKQNKPLAFEYFHVETLLLHNVWVKVGMTAAIPAIQVPVPMQLHNLKFMNL